MDLMKSLNFAEVYNMLGGITGWREAGYPVVELTTQPTTTSPTITTTTTTNNLPTDCLVLDLILPGGFVEKEVMFSISVVVTNTGNSQLSCDIPITITDVVDPTNIVTYVISVTLDPNETKEVSFDEAFLPLGSYNVQAGDIVKPLEAG